MKKLRFLAAVIPAALLGAGCVSLSSLQSARAAPEGQLRAALGLTMAAVSPPGAQSTALFLPVPELAVRYGLGSGLDIGAKAGPLGSQFEVKAEVISTERAVISLAPAFGLFFVSNPALAAQSSSQTNLALHLPLLIGIQLPGGHEFVFGPRLSGLMIWQTIAAQTGHNHSFVMGGTAGVGFRVSDGLRIQPEFNLGSKVAGDAGTGGTAFQFGLGFLFGR